MSEPTPQPDLKRRLCNIRAFRADWEELSKVVGAAIKVTSTTGQLPEQAEADSVRVKDRLNRLWPTIHRDLRQGGSGEIRSIISATSLRQLLESYYDGPDFVEDGYARLREDLEGGRTGLIRAEGNLENELQSLGDFSTEDFLALQRRISELELENEQLRRQLRWWASLRRVVQPLGNAAGKPLELANRHKALARVLAVAATLALAIIGSWIGGLLPHP